jgi:uncharacterized membrane protein
VSKIREDVTIAAPIDDVFAFFDDVANASVLVPALVEVTNVQEHDEDGHRRVEYNVRGRSGDVVAASSVRVECDPPRRTVTRGVQSGIETTSTREFVASATGGTRVVATVEWSVPIKFLAGLVTAPLRGPLRRSLRESLAAAKAALEA